MKHYTLITFDTGLYMVADDPRDEKYYFNTYAGAELFRNLLNKWEREWEPSPKFVFSDGTTSSYSIINSVGHGQWSLYITPNFRINVSKNELPNRFHRLVHKLILGFEWRKS